LIKPLANLTIRRKENTKIDQIGDEKKNVTTNTNETQGITRKYFEKLYSNKLENVEDNKFLDAIEPQN
jgi:hypothetical protein